MKHQKNLTRRHFIQRSGLATAVIGLAVVGCGGGGGEDALTCDDVSGLTPAELAARSSNQYVSDSPHGATKNCLNCNFGQNLTASSCGTCTVIKGSIDPDGYCNLWVAKS